MVVDEGPQGSETRAETTDPDPPIGKRTIGVDVEIEPKGNDVDQDSGLSENSEVGTEPTGLSGSPKGWRYGGEEATQNFGCR